MSLLARVSLAIAAALVIEAVIEVSLAVAGSSVNLPLLVGDFRWPVRALHVPMPMARWACIFILSALLELPTLLIAFLAYGGITWWFGRKIKFETRCRKCRYILRGITEPRCPECGERI